MDIKKIGILTSGGDAPGMNAIIYSVVKNAKKNNIDVIGIYRGYNGLIHGNLTPLSLMDVNNIVQRGGTILYSDRCLEFKTEKGLEKAKKTCSEQGIDALIVVGGDGTFRGAYDLFKLGVPCVGLPGTIDNDISCTEYTLGYDTAVNTAVEMVDKLCDTVTSHDRCSVVEVMGRRSGYIALYVGMSCGASYIVTREVEFNEEYLFSKMKEELSYGKKSFIIVVAEGLLDVFELAKKIEKETGVESRATVLGHVQRGGSPTVKDRVIGTRFGARAVELLVSGKYGMVIGLKDNKLVEYEIPKGLEIKKEFPKDLYEVAKGLF